MGLSKFDAPEIKIKIMKMGRKNRKKGTVKLGKNDEKSTKTAMKVAKIRRNGEIMG